MEPHRTELSTIDHRSIRIRNNELVEKFQEIRTLHTPLSRHLLKSFTELWTNIIKLPYGDNSAVLILTSSCNLILSQLINAHTQLNHVEVLSIGYKAFRKIVWWETPLVHHYSNSCIDLVEEISFLVDRFIEQEDMFGDAGSLFLYLCILMYLSSRMESVLELVRKVSTKLVTLKQVFHTDNNTILFIPLCDITIQRSLDEFTKSVHAIATLLTATESSVVKYDPLATNALTHQCINQLKILQAGLHADVPKEICSSILSELYGARNCDSSFPCLLSPSILASNLPPTIQPPLAIKLLSLSLRQERQLIPLVQASLAVNLVTQLQIADESSMQKDALLLAERYLRNHAMSVKYYSEVDENILSAFQLLTVPSPSWAQFKLARIMLREKRYSEAVTMYCGILNSPLSFGDGEKKNREKPMCTSTNFKVVLHEYSLALLLSCKLMELKDFLADLPNPDFVMLILQAELMLKLRIPEDGIKTLKRAILGIECAAMDSDSKNLILDVCHALLDGIALHRFKFHEEIDISKVSRFNATESLSCPSCSGTLTNPVNENHHQNSKDLAICHLFHEV